MYPNINMFKTYFYKYNFIYGPTIIFLNNKTLQSFEYHPIELLQMNQQ